MDLNLVGIAVAFGTTLIMGRQRILERRTEIAERTMLDLDLRILGQLKDGEDREAAYRSVLEHVEHVYLERNPERNASLNWGFNWVVTTVVLVALWSPLWSKPLPEEAGALGGRLALFAYEAFILLLGLMNIWRGFSNAHHIKGETKERAETYVATMNARIKDEGKEAANDPPGAA